MADVLFIATFFLIGLWAGSFTTTAVERLPHDDEFHFQIFEEGDAQADSVSWWMRIPFIFFFVRNPFEYPMRWHDKVPILPYFVYAWRYSNFKKLLAPVHCRVCRTRLPWRRRIPVVSYLVQHGRCHACRTKIPGRHPILELVTGALFGLMAHRFGLTWLLPMVLLVVVLFVIASVVDWRYQIIPDELNIVGLVAGVSYALVTPLLLEAGVLSDQSLLRQLGSYDLPYSSFHPARALLGILAGAGPLYLFAELGGMIAGTDAMGGGDIKLAGWIGTFLGPQGILVGLFYSALIAAPCGVLLIVLGKGKREGGFTKFAFGPYICMGAGLVMYHGADRMTSAYMEINERLITLLLHAAGALPTG